VCAYSRIERAYSRIVCAYSRIERANADRFARKRIVLRQCGSFCAIADRLALRSPHRRFTVPRIAIRADRAHADRDTRIE